MRLKQHKFLTSAVMIAVFALAFYMVMHIRLEEDFSKLIPSDPKLKKQNIISQNSSFLERVIVNVSLADTSESADPDALISFTQKLVDSLQVPGTRRMIKSITYQVDDKILADLFNEIFNNLPVFLEKNDYEQIKASLTDEQINERINRDYKLLISPAAMMLGKSLIRDPLNITSLALKKFQMLQFSDSYSIYKGFIFTQSRKNLLFFISPSAPSHDSNTNAELLARINSVIKAAISENKGRISAEPFGGTVVAIDNSDRIKKDIIVTVALSVILLVIFITYFVRIRWAALLTFLPALFGAVVSLTVLSLIKGKVSSISLGIGSILLGIGVDYALYILSQINESSNLSKVIRKLAFPIMLCSITTAAVFYCLLYVKTEALQDLGLFMAVSILGAAVFAIFILPYLFKLLRIERTTFRATTQMDYLKWFINSSPDKKKPVILIVILATVIFYFFSQKVDFDSDMSKMSYMSEVVRKAENHLKKITNFSLNNIFIISSGKNLDEALKNNEAVIDSIEVLKNKGIVNKISSVSSIIPSSAEQIKRIKTWNDFWTKERKDRVKKLIVAKSQPLGFSSNAFSEFFASLDKQYTNLSEESINVFRSTVISNWIFQQDSEVNVMSLLKVNSGHKQKVYDKLSGLKNVYVSDRHSITEYLVKTLRADFDFLIGISSILIFLLLIAFFGRIELGIITIIPIILSWVWTKGIMGITGENFTIFNIIISTLIFGTGVDYCILIMRSLQQEYSLNEKSLHSFKAGIFLSSFTTIIGAGVLYFAEHPSLRSIAMLPIVGFISVIILTFTLEPVMARWLMPGGKRKGTYPVTLFAVFTTFYMYLYFLLGCLLMTVLNITVFSLMPVNRKKRGKLFSYAISIFCGSLVNALINLKRNTINPNKEDFSRPAIIVSNHQSVIDILVLIKQSPKIIMLTNNWVWNSPVFGRIVKAAGFCNVSEGIENILPQLKQKVEDGYSIAVFPEGTRSKDNRIARFHKGAFYIAQKLKLDILPIVIHGSGDVIKKGEHLIRSGSLTVKYLDRICCTEEMVNEDTSILTHRVCSIVRNEYSKLRKEIEIPEYFKDKLIKNYIYKKTTLEWYLRIKLRAESYYSDVIAAIPYNAVITDLGCGYGFLSYLLSFTAERRKIIGVDHDSEKIALANNCFSKNDSLEFVCADVSDYEIVNSDVIIFYDLLHYLNAETQEKLLVQSLNKLNENGIILVRDSNGDKTGKHFVSELIEKFSIGLGFNKIKDRVQFQPRDFWIKIAEKHGFTVSLIHSSRINSNELYIIKKNIFHKKEPSFNLKLLSDVYEQ